MHGYLCEVRVQLVAFDQFNYYTQKYCIRYIWENIGGLYTYISTSL